MKLLVRMYLSSPNSSVYCRIHYIGRWLDHQIHTQMMAVFWVKIGRLICSTCRISTSRTSPHSWLIIGFVTRVIRRVPLVKQKLLTLPEHLSSPPVFIGVRVTRSLVLCVMICRSFVLLLFVFWPLCCLGGVMVNVISSDCKSKWVRCTVR